MLFRSTVTDNGGATGSSNVTITVNPAPTLNAPSNLTATVSSKTVTLHWTDNSTNEDGFYIERAVNTKNPSFSRVGQAGANVTTYSETVSSGSYLYRAQAFNATMVSAYSSRASVRVR